VLGQEQPRPRPASRSAGVLNAGYGWEGGYWHLAMVVRPKVALGWAMTHVAHQETANIELAAGPLRLRAEVRVTVAGILAVTALVGGIIIASGVMYLAATRFSRREDQRSMLSLKTN
jgi:hypothetical protein